MDAKRFRTIMHLALPIIGGMVSQNVLNLVDTAMVGTLGPAALGAVGIASIATFLSQAFLTGLSSGVQAMAARRKGERRDDETAIPLNGGLLVAGVVGLPLSLAMILLAPRFFPLLVDDPEVTRIGSAYFQVRLAGVTAVAMNFCFRGFWNGVSLSRLYLSTLLVMHTVNIALNYLLIFGKLGFPELGATGAAIGTTASIWIGTGTYVILGFVHARKGGFLRGLPDGETLRTMLRLSVPTGVQQMFYAGGLTALLTIVGKLGTAELASANVLINVGLVGYLPGIALGIAAASLVGQALGRGDVDDARAWGWDVCKVAIGVLVLIGLPMVVFPEEVIGVFMKDAATIAVAKLPLQLVGATLAFDGIGFVLMNALLGAGDTRRVAVLTTLLQWAVFLPVAYLVGPVLGLGLIGVWGSQAVYRAIQSLIFVGMWRADSWQAIKV